MKRSVLIIGNFLSEYGAARGICEDLAERLAGRDWRVTTSSRKRAKLSRLLDMCLTVQRHAKEYAVAQVDVYSGAAFFWAETVCWRLRSLGKPYVLTLHGGNLPVFAARYPGRVRHLLGGARAVTAPSSYLKEQLEPFCPQIRIIPNPIDMGRYSYRLRKKARPAVIWLRAFHEKYNPQLAVAVAAAIIAKYPDFRLTMVGPDKGDGSFQRTEAEVRAKGLESRVNFPGSIPKAQVPAALGEADVFLNTTDVDNTPISVVEAMACGLSVVSTKVGGIGYLLRDQIEALLVPARDPAAMTQAVERILSEPDLGERLSRNGREKVERFDWSYILPKWEELLGAIMSRPPDN